MLLRPLRLRLAPHRPGFPPSLYDASALHSLFNNNVVAYAIKIYTTYKFLRVVRDLKKWSKNVKKHDFWPLFRENDGPGLGSSQPPKITIFDDFFVPPTVYDKKILSYTCVVTLHCVTLHFLHHTVHIFMLQKA